MTKKGQTTIFLMMGVVVLIVFGAFFYLAESIAQYTTEKNAERIIESYLDSSAVRQTITNCLSLSTVEATSLIANQGGFIFTNQPGSTLITNPPKIESEDYNISFSIIKDRPGVHDTPKYPCHNLGSNRTSYPCHFNYYERGYFFGGHNPLLHKSNNIPPLYKRYIPGFSFYFSYDYSFEEQLESLILNLTMQCSNLSIYNQQEYGISYGIPSLNVSIGKNDVQTILSFPFSVNMSDSKVVKNYDFYSAKTIRLRDLWSMMNDIIYKETTDLQYNIISSPLITNVKLKKTISGNDYIFSLLDEEFYVRDKPFTLSVGIADRSPALTCIGACDGSDFDIIIPVNSTLTLKPYAIDPDEEQVVYVYGGWKADYDERWPQNISKFNTQLPITYNQWHMSDVYSNGGNCDYPNTLVEGYRRCAQIYVNESDVGPHEVIVYARDPNNNLYDSQVIKILVDTKGVPQIENTSIYNDTPGHLASIEDPFYLDASNSRMLLGGEVYFRWKDDKGTLFVNTTERRIKFPSENPDIMDIVNHPFLTAEEHRLKLKIYKSNSNLTSEESIKRIDVLACLPHRTTIKTAPYPFNQVPFDDYMDVADPFQADHACCGNETNNYGSVASSNTICYQYASFACRSIYQDNLPMRRGFIINDSTPIWPATLALGITNNLATPKFWVGTQVDSLLLYPNHVNDIYSRDFSQKCDGTRGNVCKGEQNDIWQHETSCGICQYCSWGDQNCRDYDPGIVCNSTLKCVSDFSRNAYNFISGKTDIVAMATCDGAGSCGAVLGTSNAPPSFSNKNVYPYGAYSESTNYKISEDCNFYDKAIANELLTNETCYLEDWTCMYSPGANCGIDYNITIDCNIKDYPIGSHNSTDPAVVDESRDTCEWTDFGVNSSSCSIFNPNTFTFSGCSKSTNSSCCEIEQQAGTHTSIFDCDSLDITNTSRARLVEAEATYDSCMFGDVGSEGCYIASATCSASTVCTMFQNYSEIPLDEVQNFTCVYKNPVEGFKWTNNTPNKENYCYDGYDNDCDGLTDCQDPDCYSRYCEQGNIGGVCVASGICEIDEICRDDLLRSGCASCGMGIACNKNINLNFYPYEDKGICVAGTSIFCEVGQVCNNSITNILHSGCSDCSQGDFCDSDANGTFIPDGTCTQTGCCNSIYNDTVREGSLLYCGCTPSLNNFDCNIKNSSVNFLANGHCQEESCCPLANGCLGNDCNATACDEDSDCPSYINQTTGTCFYGQLGNGDDGDCTSGCTCSYNTITAEEVLGRFGIVEPCEYGFLFAGYCLKDAKCVSNCNCGAGGWLCDIDECPSPGTNVGEACFSENFIDRRDDCTPFGGCTLTEEGNPKDFYWSECLSYSTSPINNFCQTRDYCFFNSGPACHRNDGWTFQNVTCRPAGTITGNSCSYGEDGCGSSGCNVLESTTKRNDCSYHSGVCPGPSCTYHFDLIGQRCDQAGGWQCFNSSSDLGDSTCDDYDGDMICNQFETNPCDRGENIPQCRLGTIVSFSHNSFLVNYFTRFNITIRNDGVEGSIKLEPIYVPNGISLDDFESDFNDYVIRFMELNEEITIEYGILANIAAPNTYPLLWNLSYRTPLFSPDTKLDTKQHLVTIRTS